MKNNSKVMEGVDALEASTRRVQSLCAQKGSVMDDPEPPVPTAVQRQTPSSPFAAAIRAAAATATLAVFASLIGATCADLPPVANCTPSAQRCHDNRPEVCSATRRWHAVGDMPCTAPQLGAVCLVNDAGVAYCGRAP